MTTSPPPDAVRPLPRWSDQGPLLIDLAVADLEAGHEVLPTMVAFQGDQPLFLATLRPFLKGRHQDAIIEIGALAMGLAADRMILSLSGRAWSLADPIAPVLPDGGDLRQRVIVLHQADATTEDPSALSTIVPVELVRPGGDRPDQFLRAGEDADSRDDLDGTGDVDSGPAVMVRTGPALTDQGGEGWVPRALLTLVTAGEGPVDEQDLGIQVRRCEQLGHRLGWSPTVMPLIDRARMRALDPQCAGGGRSAEDRPPEVCESDGDDVAGDRAA